MRRRQLAYPRRVPRRAHPELRRARPLSACGEATRGIGSVVLRPALLYSAMARPCPLSTQILTQQAQTVPSDVL